MLCGLTSFAKLRALLRLRADQPVTEGSPIDLVRRRALFRWVATRHRVEMAAGAPAEVTWGEPGGQLRLAAVFLPQTPCIELETVESTAGLEPFAPASVRVNSPEGSCSFAGIAFVAGERLLRMGWPSQMEMADRRRAPRLPWPVRLRYRPYSFRGRNLALDNRYADATAVDFSGTGISLSSRLSLPPGMVLSLLFEDGPLAGLKPMPGLVRHSRGEGERFRLGLELLVDDPLVYRRLLTLHERLLELRGA